MLTLHQEQKIAQHPNSVEHIPTFVADLQLLED